MLPEVGVTEALVIAAIALIVVGPKDLPMLMRKVGQFLAKMRAMASEFRASFDELARQSELEELRKEVDAMRQQRYDAVMGMDGAHDAMREIDDHLNDRVATDAAQAAFDAQVSGHPYVAPPVEPEAPAEPAGEDAEQPSLFPIEPMTTSPHPSETGR
jgi:sec-independent protein translocase protein TatB